MAGTFPQDVEVSTNTTLGATHINHRVMATAGASGITLTLPLASSWRGSYTCICRMDSGSKNVTLACSGSDTINGETTLVLDSQYQTVVLISDGGVLWSIENSTFRFPGGLLVGPHLSLFNQYASDFYTDGAKNIVATLNALKANGNGYSYGLLSVNEDNSGSGGITHDIWGLYGVATATHTSGTKGNVIGIEGDAYNEGAGNVTILAGMSGYAEQDGSGTVAKLVGVQIYPNVRLNAGTVTNAYGIYIDSQVGVANGGVPNNYQIFSNTVAPFVVRSDGRVGIGTIAPTGPLQVVGLAEYADNAAAITAGLTAGAFYRTGDLLKVVH